LGNSKYNNWQKNKESEVQEISINSNLESNKGAVAEHFNKFFANIASDIVANINPPNTLSLTNDPEKLIPENKLFNMSGRPLQQGELSSALNSLLPKFSKDYHDLSMNFLKTIAPTIEKPLLYVFGRSLAQGMVPNKLKIARIAPIFKGGDKTNVTNYRPISLLCNFAKILEKIVQARLTKFINENNLLSNKQFGFRSMHSTVHPALLAHNFITESLNKKKDSRSNFL